MTISQIGLYQKRFENIIKKDVPADNGDMVTEGIKGKIYTGIDAAGTVRNATVIGQSSIAIAGAAKCASIIFLPIVAVLLIGSGMMCAVTACKWAIPDACKTLADAMLYQSSQTEFNLAVLGLVNMVLYLSMGLAQMACGITDLLVTFGHVSGLASVVSGIGLALIYILRGLFMGARALQNYWITREMHREFQKTVQRRDHSLEGINLLEAHKKIEAEQWKHFIAVIISAAMVLGGIASTLAFTVFTAGLGPLIVAICSAAFFCLMELVFIPYDSDCARKTFTDAMYSVPNWMPAPKIDRSPI